MNKCKITLDEIKGDDKYNGYSAQGLKSLFGNTQTETILRFTRTQFIQDKPGKQKGLSISGYQPKLSVRLEDNILDVTEKDGQYILKPSPEAYPYLAENEHATMKVMSSVGMNTPPFGLVLFKSEEGMENELVFIIKRYDRAENGLKIHQEQLDGAMGIDDKYGNIGGVQTVSYERVAKFLIENIDKSLAFKKHVFLMVVFAYVLGNNDLHLKNFGIIMLEDGRKQIAPVYDFINVAPYTTTFESCFLALPLLEMEEHEKDLAPGFNTQHGCYIGYDFIQFGIGIGLSEKLAIKCLSEVSAKKEIIQNIYTNSFMNENDTAKAIECVASRMNKIGVLEYSPL